MNEEGNAREVFDGTPPRPPRDYFSRIIAGAAGPEGLDAPGSGRGIFAIVGLPAVLICGFAIGLSGFSLCDQHCRIENLGSAFTLIGIAVWFVLLCVGPPGRRTRGSWFGMAAIFVGVVIVAAVVVTSIPNCAPVPGGACF